MDDHELLRRIRETLEDNEGINRIKERWRVTPSVRCPGCGSSTCAWPRLECDRPVPPLAP